MDPLHLFINTHFNNTEQGSAFGFHMHPPVLGMLETAHIITLYHYLGKIFIISHMNLFRFNIKQEIIVTMGRGHVTQT